MLPPHQSCVCLDWFIYCMKIMYVVIICRLKRFIAPIEELGDIPCGSFLGVGSHQWCCRCFFQQASEGRCHLAREDGNRGLLCRLSHVTMCGALFRVTVGFPVNLLCPSLQLSHVLYSSIYSYLHPLFLGLLCRIFTFFGPLFVQ